MWTGECAWVGVCGWVSSNVGGAKTRFNSISVGQQFARDGDNGIPLAQSFQVDMSCFEKGFAKFSQKNADHNFSAFVFFLVGFCVVVCLWLVWSGFLLFLFCLCFMPSIFLTGA